MTGFIFDNAAGDNALNDPGNHNGGDVNGDKIADVELRVNVATVKATDFRL